MAITAQRKIQNKFTLDKTIVHRTNSQRKTSAVWVIFLLIICAVIANVVPSNGLICDCWSGETQRGKLLKKSTLDLAYQNADPHITFFLAFFYTGLTQWRDLFTDSMERFSNSPVPMLDDSAPHDSRPIPAFSAQVGDSKGSKGLGLWWWMGLYSSKSIFLCRRPEFESGHRGGVDLCHLINCNHNFSKVF